MKKIVLGCLFVWLTCVCVAANAINNNAANIERLKKQKWLYITSANFQIVTDASEKTGRQLLKDLEAYLYLNKSVFNMNLAESTPPFRILAVNREKTFRYLGYNEFWAGFVRLNGPDTYAVANIAGYKDTNRATFGSQVLFHEYVHFLTYFTNQGTRLPYWFNEGRAEYLGTFRYDKNNMYLGDVSGGAEGRISGLYTKHGQLAINSEDVLSKTQAFEMTKRNQLEVHAFYARSLFIYHYFNAGAERRQQLNALISAQVRGVPAEQALREATGLSFAEFDQQVKTYVMKSLQMRVLSLKDGQWTLPDVEPKVEKLSEEKFLMLLNNVFYLQ